MKNHDNTTQTSLNKWIYYAEEEVMITDQEDFSISISADIIIKAQIKIK